MLSRSFSSKKADAPSRLKVEVPPGSRRAVGHRIERKASRSMVSLISFSFCDR